MQLAGLAFITIGAIVLVKIDDYDKIFEDYNVHVAPIVFIVLGSIIFVIAFFGCCGAMRESQCLTNLYATMMLVLIIGQIILASFIFVYRTDVTDAAVKAYDRIFQNRDQQANREIIDTVQSNVSTIEWDSLNWKILNLITYSS